MSLPVRCLALLALLALCACSDGRGNLAYLPDAAEAQPAPPPIRLESYTNTLGMTFVRIPEGSFVMGLEAEQGGRPDERPMATPTRVRPVFFGIHEVTQAQWTRVMGTNPSAFQPGGKFVLFNSYNTARQPLGFTGNEPVENVSWNDAQEFVAKLNALEGNGGYRLPTEAEWEYVARVGGAVSALPINKALWPVARGTESYFSNARGGMTFPVGHFAPNQWGVHDLEGNVREWCADAYAPYGRQPQQAERRVNRGSCWLDPQNTRLTERYCNKPDFKSSLIGLRLVKEIR